MSSINEFSWQCPSCNEALNLHSRVWQCSNNHRFDCAKEGYVNLLLSQYKNSKAPGDSKEMVIARQQFLEQDHYKPLADKISAVVASFAKPLSPLALFDAGCGEGYYTAQILDSLNAQDVSVIASGIDISKPAVIKAAKRKKAIQFAVASTYQIPLATDSQDIVLQVFAPSSAEEIHRVLKHGGTWITVNPAEEHLFELKRMVYDQPAKHSVDTQVSAGFKEHSEYRCQFEIELSTEQQRENLLMMTPFYWSISEDKKQRVLQNLLKVNTDFVISVYQKSSAR